MCVCVCVWLSLHCMANLRLFHEYMCNDVKKKGDRNQEAVGDLAEWFFIVCSNDFSKETK